MPRPVYALKTTVSRSDAHGTVRGEVSVDNKIPRAGLIKALSARVGIDPRLCQRLENLL